MNAPVKLPLFDFASGNKRAAFRLPPPPKRRYPDVPGFKGAADGTSAEAAVKISEHIPRIRGLVLQAYRDNPDGLTADQVAVRLGLSILTVRPRVSELHKSGFLIATLDRRANESGMSARVWRIAQPKIRGAQ